VKYGQLDIVGSGAKAAKRYPVVSITSPDTILFIANVINKI